MPIEKILNTYKQLVDTILLDYLDTKINIYRKDFSECVDMLLQLKDLIARGGDRIRPTLFYYGFCAIRKPTQAEKKELLRLATAFELFHSFALIHDDIIDRSKMRRGKQSVHEYFNRQFGNLWGERLALIAGDLAQIFSDEIFCTRIFINQYISAKQLFEQMKEQTMVGEYMDTIFPLSTQMPSESEIRDMMYLKTAQYSVGSPLVIGAVLADASDNQKEALSQFGGLVGSAFQIRDDILGIYGNQTIIGKSTVSDITEGKRTLLVAKTLDNINNRAEKQKFLELFQKRKKTKEDVMFISTTIRNSGAFVQCQKECESLVRQAKQFLKRDLFQYEAIVFLTEVSDFIIERDY